MKVNFCFMKIVIFITEFILFIIFVLIFNFIKWLIINCQIHRQIKRFLFIIIICFLFSFISLYFNHHLYFNQIIIESYFYDTIFLLIILSLFIKIIHVLNSISIFIYFIICFNPYIIQFSYYFKYVIYYFMSLIDNFNEPLYYSSLFLGY